MGKYIVGAVVILGLLGVSEGAFADEKILVYNELREDQDMSIDGELVEIYSPYLDDLVLIKRFSGETRETHKDFNLPLEVGMKWDQLGEGCTDNMYCYYVEKKVDVIVPAGTFKDCFKIVYRTCPDDEGWWYASGVGVVKYEYRHHGTITNITHELKEIAMR
ncbi:MAG: hypothetical protein ABIG92_05695 [Candidatus Omnitrophota bacterium]